MFNFPKCPTCNSTLPIATGVCAHCPPSSLPGHQDLCDSLAAPAQVDQVGGTPTLEQPSLPVDVPESETLWLFLTKGYSLNYIRESLVCGIPHLEAEARMLRDRAHKNWAQIRAEVGA